jgi:hypothetical protein
MFQALEAVQSILYNPPPLFGMKWLHEGRRLTVFKKRFSRRTQGVSPPASAPCLPPCSRWYPRLGSARPPALAHAWLGRGPLRPTPAAGPALVAAGRPR